MRTEVIFAKGHKNIRALNRTTLEITRDNYLTERGDCIIAICADKGFASLSRNFKKKLKNDKTKIKIVIEVENFKDEIEAWGDPKLLLEHPTDMVIRKSSYVCGRTLAIKANKSAIEISRNLVSHLKSKKADVRISMTLEDYSREINISNNSSNFIIL